MSAARRDGEVGAEEARVLVQGLGGPDEVEDGRERDGDGGFGAVDEGMMTVDEAIEAAGFGPFQLLLLFYTGMAWVGEAMEMMLLSFIGPVVRAEWGLTPTEESTISSVVFVGMLIGAYSWSLLSDIKGRRFGFLATAVITFIAGLGSALAPNYGALLLMRGLVGLGLGGGPTVFSLFTEFLPSKSRGFWLVAISFFWTAGSVLEACLAWAVLPTLGWRWLLGLSAIPLFFLLLLYPLLPESPRFLLAVKGDDKAAMAVLQRMSHANKRPLPLRRLAVSPLLQHGLLEKADSLPRPDKALTTWPQTPPLPWLSLPPLRRVFLPLLASPLRQSTLLLWGIFFANSFTYYGLVLLTAKLAGPSACNDASHWLDVSAAAPATSSLYRDVLVTAVAEVPGLAAAAALVDRIGRKRTMEVMFLLCGACLLPLVVPQSEGLTTLLLFVARGSIMAAFTGLYIYAPELYPTTVRTTGLGVANSFGRIGGFLCPIAAVGLIDSCQRGLGVGLFAVLPTLAAFGAFALPIETKGRVLDEVAEDDDRTE